MIKQRGATPGIVCILSAMEACDSYQPWHDKQTDRTFLFFSALDQDLFQAISRGQYLVSGFRSKDIRRQFPEFSAGWISRSLKRLRVHGIIRKIGRTYKYYLSRFGKRIVATGQHLKELFLVPHLAAVAAK